MGITSTRAVEVMIWNEDSGSVLGSFLMNRTIPLVTEPTKDEAGPACPKATKPSKESAPSEPSICAGDGCLHQIFAFRSVGSVPMVSWMNTGSPLLIRPKSVSPALSDHGRALGALYSAHFLGNQRLALGFCAQTPGRLKQLTKTTPANTINFQP